MQYVDFEAHNAQVAAVWGAYHRRRPMRVPMIFGFMEGGRFILREGNNLAPDIALANLWAMYDTVGEHGQYTRAALTQAVLRGGLGAGGGSGNDFLLNPWPDDNRSTIWNNETDAYDTIVWDKFVERWA